MSRARSSAEKTSDAAPRTSSSEHAQKPSPTPRPESLAGNFAVQRLVQARLRVGNADDPQEHAADRVAESVTSCGGCSAGAPCAACAGDRRVRRKESAGAAAAETWLPERSVSRLGSGAALDPSLRALFQPRFGSDLSRVRVHTGADAAASARSIQARAFTTGRDVVFDEGEYRPQTTEGQKLIAHELAHVEQNGEPVRRVVNGDIRQMSITAGWARDLNDDEIEQQLRIVRGQIRTFAAGTPEHDTAQSNLEVLQTDYRRRHPDAPAPGDVVPRPAGLPLTGGYQLTPINVPADVASRLPDGQLLPLSAALGSGGGSGTPLASTTSTPLASGFTPHPVTTGIDAFAGGWAGMRINLSTYGFNAAGDYAIGIVAFPRYAPGRFLQGMSSLIPEHPVILGHSAVYVRAGGRIVIARSYAPSSLTRTAGMMSEIEAGTAGTEAAIYTERGLIDIFNVSNARSMEWAVPAQQARAFAQGLPQGSTYGFAEGMEGALYTARPAVAQMCQGTNCVGWALQQVEGELGTIASATDPAVSVGSLGAEGQVVSSEFSQGRLIRFMQQAQENPNAIAALRTAEGDVLPMAAGSLSRGAQVLKWGGRVMLVVGIVSIPVEVALARPEERVRTGIGAGAGFLGGLALGATAGLVCGPGAPVCSFVAGVGLGIAGAFGARWGAESIYDAATGRSSIGSHTTVEWHPQCPGQASCHNPNPPRPSPFTFAGQGRSTQLSAADIAIIRAWMQRAPASH